LATTNYPELLGSRIVNRPSRFDKRIKIGHPNAESRKIYLKHLICDHKKAKEEGLTTEKKRNEYVLNKAKDLGIDLELWVKDTKEFSIAHLKELFIATVILGDNYEDAITTLRSMRDNIRSSDADNSAKVGFLRASCDDED
jgi:SpoVK/Ycf46/Vps4 family AAA+-type ATPase